MVTAGKSQKEAAQVFGVSEGAVSKVMKDLNLNVVRSVGLENARRIFGKSLNSFDQLQKNNKDANEILDLLMCLQRGEGEPEAKFKGKNPRELALKAM